MSNISASTINELFVQKLNSPEGLEKVAMEGSSFIRQKLREVSFARKIIQPEYVTKADLQRSVNHDGLVRIVDIEPDSKAMTVNFRGQPTSHYLQGERYEIPFYMISSEDFQKTEEELLAYEMPLTEVIERNSVKDIQKIEDQNFLNAIDVAVGAAASNGSTNNYDYASSGLWQDANGGFDKGIFENLFNMLDGKELRAETILMSTVMFNKLFRWDATSVGDAVGSELSVNGYTYASLFGRKLVVSNKVDLLSSATDHHIYAFAAQEFLGNFNVLNDTKFWIEKKKNVISFAAYETLGIGIGNTSACAKLTLSKS
ncbi:hypothetical protein H8D85_01680 [bacterium]|nr:hypothetical protein [bacterium]